MNLNPFKSKSDSDKYLLQMNMVVGDGFNGGLSVNIPKTTDIQAMHEISDKMRRVLDRQRAIHELPIFREKLDIIEAQLSTAKEDLVKYQAQAEEEEAQGGAPKTATNNQLDNLRQNVEHLTAEAEIGRGRVENIRKRTETSEQTLDDIRALNELGVAA